MTQPKPPPYVRWGMLLIGVVSLVSGNVAGYIQLSERMAKVETLQNVVRNDQLQVQEQLREGCK